MCGWFLTKAGDCFWELAVWSGNFQMACKDFERSPAGSLSLLVRCLPSDIYFDSGTSQLKLQVSRPRCTAMIDCNTLTFSGLSSKRFLTCSPTLGESCLLGCPCILDPYICGNTSSLPSPLCPSSQPSHVDLQEQCCHLVYAPIQRACLSWTWLSTGQCWQIWWQQLPHWRIGFPSGLKNKRGNKSLG